MDRIGDETLLDDLAMTTRSANCLKNEGCKTCGDVRLRADQELLRFSNFGIKSLNELYEIGILEVHNRPLDRSYWGSKNRKATVSDGWSGRIAGW